MAGGGARPGAGRKPGSAAVVGARGWLRSVCEDQDRRKAVAAAIDADLKAGKTESFFRAYEHGYGRPPQALDVRTQSTGPVEYVVTFGAGAASGTAVPADLSEPDVSVGGTD